MGTHFTLLREPQTNAAKVFMFGERVGSQKIDVWRFFAAEQNYRLPDTLNPNAGVSRIFKVPHPDTLQNDLFCNGHAPLPDGRMLFIGGWIAPTDPCEMTYLFRPSWLPDSGGTPWTLGPTMATERWYATATSMADGSILATGGLARNWHAVFGGVDASGASRGILNPLSVAGRSHWGDTLTVPGYAGAPLVGRAPKNIYTAGQWPESRTDHAAAWCTIGRTVIFGGRHVESGGASTVLGDAWMLESAEERVAGDSVATWRRLRQLDFDDTPGVPEDIPPARYRAALVWAGVPGGDNFNLPGARDSMICFLFGGRDAGGHVFSDLWRGVVDTQEHDDGTLGGWVRDIRWRKLLADGDTTHARFGHAMWFDPGDGNDKWAPKSRLVIFGGQRTATALADTFVYSYGIGSSTAPTWQSHLPDSSTKWGQPRARQGHASTYRWPLDPGSERLFYIYGGQDAQGNLIPDTRWGLAADTHVWALSRKDTTTNSPHYAWKWIAWTNPDSGWTGPLARARAAMVYDDESGRLVVTGGDLNGEGQPGGLTDTLWTLQLKTGYVQGSRTEWKRPAMRSMGHPAMPPTAGHTMISYGSSGHRMDNTLETFSLARSESEHCDAGVSVPGSWQTLSEQSSYGQQAMTWYPYLFLLPDGRLFHAGPAQGDRLGDRPYKRFYGLQPGGANYREWTDNSSVYTYDTWAPGSAVMYRPGKILRAGSHAGVDLGNGATAACDSTEIIEITSGGTPAWVRKRGNSLTTFNLAKRLNHNLTVLPTGDVLATGGVTGDLNNSANAPVRRPQLWRVQTGGWNDTSSTADLAADWMTRNYHSAALLLPDARVMTAGGEPPNKDRFTVSIYEPPYLFSGEGYARRPIITGAPEHLRYGEPFTLGIDTSIGTSDVDSIRTVALLRPGAATHGFDQSQRYVPLDFVPRSGPSRILAWAPPDSFVAPPGEYMLFVTRGRGTSADSLPIPSMAKWVVVERPQGVQRDSLDTTAPRGGAYLDLRLHATGQCNQTAAVLIDWTAPADDDTVSFSGRARGYDLRWVRSDSSSGRPFSTWNPSGTNPPQGVFSTEEDWVSGLSTAYWYKFALRAFGDNADTSAVSSTVTAKPQFCDGGSGGGGYEDGGFGARRAETNAAGRGSASGGLGPENTLLATVALGERGRDLLRLATEPGRFGATRRAYVRQGERRGLLVERARLMAVDHDPFTEVVALPTGELLMGRRTAASHVRDRAGADVTSAATGAGAEPVYADSGEVLEVTLAPRAEATPRTLLLDLLGGGTDSRGITIEARLESGAWEPVATLHPRREWDTQVVRMAAADRVRLTMPEAYALRFVGELVGAVPVTAQAATLVGANSRYSGDVFDAARSAVDTTLAMVVGDTLTLTFADLAPAAEGSSRTWLLEVEGTPVTPRVAQSLAHRREPLPQTAIPTRFALLPAAPNPTRGTVRIAFDLPISASAKLEVFDAQGRRIRRLEARLAPGRQAFEWDLRHSDGPRVAPGIYNYRLSAGPFTARSRVVVLP